MADIDALRIFADGGIKLVSVSLREQGGDGIHDVQRDMRQQDKQGKQCKLQSNKVPRFALGKY